jgi:two-component system sensor histidine kinase/response regulator
MFVAAKRAMGLSNESATQNASDSAADCAALLDHLDGDVDLAREVVELFLEDCPRRLGAVREALARGDADALQFAAHSIKGSVLYFGATAAVAAAVQLELMGDSGDISHAGAAARRLEQEIASLQLSLADFVRTARVERHVPSAP